MLGTQGPEKTSGRVSLVNSCAAFKTPSNEVSFHPVSTTLSPYPFLSPSQIQTLGLLFVNVGFYSRSAPGWKEGASHAQPWSSSSTSQCWARVSGKDAEWVQCLGCALTLWGTVILPATSK